MNKNEESGLSDTVQTVAQIVEEAIHGFFPHDALRMGGGTVLQARWKHRLSTDIDLFCAPQTYLEAFRVHGQAIEACLQGVCDDPEYTFADAIGIYATVQGTEVTLLPAEPLVGQRTFRLVPGTRIETWSSADILAAKLLHRLYGAGNIEPRDIYDFVAAERHEPAALHKAVRMLTLRQRKRIEISLKMLPENWMDSTDKPLLGVPESPFRMDVDTVVELLSRFSRPEAVRHAPGSFSDNDLGGGNL